MGGQPAINYSLANRSGGDGVIDISDGFSDLERFYMITNSCQTDAIGDIVQYTGAGPMNIGVGDTVKVSYALFAADSYSRMVEAVNGAIAKYSYLHGDSDSNQHGEGVAMDSKETLSVSPNPVADVLELNGVDENFEIAVYDAFGRCVFSGNNVSRLDVSEYATGTYNIVVVDDSGSRSVRFVKVK